MQSKRLIVLIISLLLILFAFSCKKETTEPEDQQTVATPTFSPAGGTYTSTQNVSIATTTANATIRYTTNGS
ncbi:MAG: chitobiase/beta-hexosaminidase C-terminal domain-containing protein, partial [Candidatus Cloacimonetes bacterium]|nr:chitobiase/beta-hexosaminidase C-terminal domain-containing protein [Candidatus Cloacimonadota bacterium]